MEFPLHGPTGRLLLTPWHSAPPTRSVRLPFDHGWLRTAFLANPGTARLLHDWLHTVGLESANPTGGSASDEQVAQNVMTLIERGVLLVDLQPRPQEETVPWGPRDAAVEPEVSETDGEATEDHWIEVRMIGDDEAGIRGIRCEITLPDGETVTRTTNHEGVVRIRGITSASDCQIRFPDLDEEAWEAA